MSFHVLETPGMRFRDEFLILSMSWRDMAWHGMASRSGAWHGMTSRRVAWFGTMALAWVGVRSGFRLSERGFVWVGFRRGLRLFKEINS